MPGVQMQAHTVNAMQDEGGSPPIALDHMTLLEAANQGQQNQVKTVEPKTNQNERLESQNECLPETINDQNIVSPISMISPQ